MTKGHNNASEWVVVYAKIVDDDKGINLMGVYFGGAAQSKQDAEVLARDCVNSLKGGTILPRLYELSRPLPEIMKDAEHHFSRKEKEMNMAASILSRQLRRR